MRAESLVASSHLAWTIVRPTMIYGTPRDRNVSRLIRLVLRSPVLPLIAPRALQQPVHVSDVAQAVVSAVDTPESEGRAYNIAGRDPLTMRQVVETVVRAVGKPRMIVPLPTGPIRAVLVGAGHLGIRLPLRVEQVDRIHENKAFDYADAARDLGFSPRTFDEGVRTELEMILGTRATGPSD
jgi:nucleoside-diphosphate-sugar epimerase